MKRLFGVVGLLAVILTAIVLYNLKTVVMQQAATVRALERREIEETKAIRVLEAEWAYLSAPEELQSRAERYLGLHAMKDGQVAISFDALPFRDPARTGEAGGVQEASTVVSEPVTTNRYEPQIAPGAGQGQPAVPLSPRATPRPTPQIEAQAQVPIEVRAR